jgi:hypothetical protein
LADSSTVKHSHMNAPAGKLISNGTANNPGANYDNAGGLIHNL